MSKYRTQTPEEFNAALSAINAATEAVHNRYPSITAENVAEAVDYQREQLAEHVRRD